MVYRWIDLARERRRLTTSLLFSYDIGGIILSTNLNRFVLKGR
jgi:hypothetical protein